MLACLTIAALLASSSLAQSSSAATTSVLWPLGGRPGIPPALYYTGVYEASVVTAAPNSTVYALACPASNNEPLPSESVTFISPYSTSSSNSSARGTSFDTQTFPTPLPCSTMFYPSFNITVGTSFFDASGLGTNVYSRRPDYTATIEDTQSVHCVVSGTTTGVQASCSTSTLRIYSDSDTTATPLPSSSQTIIPPGRVPYQTLVVTAGAEKLTSAGTRRCVTLGHSELGVIATILISMILGGLMIKL
ncbi:MAG: hypothetical protein M1820_004975 [Bogoriella megaspora]|nr:MAG: hypothetical protein M1820_004975 [Bogoriella megaspora]